MSSTAGAISDFIRSGGSVPASDTLFSNSVDLLDYGYLDSFGIVGLMEMVQKTYGLDLSDVDFYDKGHRTIDGIANLIDARLSRKA